MSTTESVMVQKIIENNNYSNHKEFYDKYKKIVHDYIKYKYPNDCDIDDDVADIMIKVFSGLKTFDSEKTKLKTWILNITKNHMIDKWRTLKTPHNIDINDNIFLTTSFIDTFEACNMITHLSSQMNPNEFSMLNMKYFYGYELKEIENEYNLNSGDAWGKIKKIKYKLKNSKIEYK